MKKIAIVGVEGSGKTVMMAAMGEQWERPDERGYFLSPENAEAFGFSKSVMSILRSGKWPSASSHDEMRHLDWSLQRRQGGSLEKIADISMLDYAGEVYRQAFGGEKKEGYDAQVATLRSHVDEADVLIVLVNLSDIINGSMQNRRTRDAMWLTKSVLDYALGEARARKPHAAIVFTQADGYRQIIASNGGTAGTLRQYLPHVANLYGNLPIFTTSAIDRTIIGDDGLPIPAPGFKSTGLQELVDWMIYIGESDKDEESHEKWKMAESQQEQHGNERLITEGVPLVHLGWYRSHKITPCYTNGGLEWLMSIRLSLVLLMLAIVLSTLVLIGEIKISYGAENVFYGFAYGISIPMVVFAFLGHLMRRLRTYNVLDLFSEGQWHKALGYKKLVYNGDGGMLYYQGVCSLFGFGGMTRDYDHAARLFHKSASQGVAETLIGLGWMAEKGYGMPQSHERALQYYAEARSMGVKDMPEIGT